MKVTKFAKKKLYCLTSKKKKVQGILRHESIKAVTNLHESSNLKQDNQVADLQDAKHSI
jgi:hypothetical protein